MYLFYSLLLTVGFIIFLPKFVLDALRSRKYVTGLSERLGRLPEPETSSKPIIWLHCVSVGETEAARPLVARLLERFPAYRIVISTTTVTGQSVARNAFSKTATSVFYFPIDWNWCVRRALNTLRPAAVVIMETELWPNFLRQCAARSIPVAIVNGRISAASFQRYRLLRRFMGRVLNHLSVALMQSEADASRIRDLGLKEEKISVSGNLKFDSKAAGDQDVTDELRSRFNLRKGQQRLIVAASTHAPEESVLIQSFKQLKAAAPDTRLMIAPRHPERFAQVAELLQHSGLTWCRRSEPAEENDRRCEVVLLDSIGELRSAYSVADVAFVGGSIAPHGGHNVMEPGAQGVGVVTGPYTHNFDAIVGELLREQAIIQLPALPLPEMAARLASIFESLLSDDLSRREIGQRAAAVCNRNRGATDRTVQTIGILLAAPESLVEPPAFSSLRITAVK
jgi:3-deoxy-D-manno-octulosonic-acid transferase